MPKSNTCALLPSGATVDTHVNAHHVLLACTAKKVSLIKAYWIEVWGKKEMDPLLRPSVSESWYMCHTSHLGHQWIHL